MTHALPPQIADLISRYGDFGIFAAMFLESSFFPLPSELVVAAAGAMGFSLMSIVVFGSLGATLGAGVGYAIGRYAGLPVILKIGKYVFITPERMAKAEAFAVKHGAWGVLLGRLLPIIPFKVFSIASGITRIPFIPFITFTFIGVGPRLYLLAVFGVLLMKYTKYVVFALAAGFLIWGAVVFARRFLFKK
ncbi:MAG: VTT domain-containing protein [Candidatus Omnitrophota bacterium]